MRITHFLGLISVIGLLLCGSFDSFAQNTRANGTVVDEAGAPLVGVAVVQKGTTNGVITDIDGNFSIAVPQGAVLEFSSVSYITQEAAAASGMNIILVEDRELLDEVVVVGYGVQKKSEITGAISSVKSEDMQNRTIANVEDALQGKTAGVQLISASSSPGASPTVRIRGYSSNTTSDPLFVVDGVRLRSIVGIDPNDIESMEVLKDAASAAIYGAEAGNGVVLITTKKGKAGDGRINYSFLYTLQKVSHLPEVMNAEQYAKYMVEGNLISQQQIDSEWNKNVDTNWYDVMYETGVIQRHSLSFSNATDKGNYYVSLGYLDNDGVIAGRKDYYRRLSASINAEQKIKSWLTVGTTNQLDHFERVAVTSNNYAMGLPNSILQMDPLTPPTYTRENLPQFMIDSEAAGIPLLNDGNGNYYSGSSFVTADSTNPLIIRDNNISSSKGFHISGSAYANLTPFKGFTFTSRLGYQVSQEGAPTVSLPFFGNATTQKKAFLDYSKQYQNTMYYQWENFANYSKTFGKHTLTAMAGMSFLKRNVDTVNGELSGNGENAVLVNDPTFYYFNYKSASAIQIVAGEDLTTAQYSWFGRVGYNYNEKYMIQASLRADAADLSYLSKNNRWGYFPAVSAGWTVSKEEFFSSLRSVFDDVKLRASWGQNGSLSALGGYSYGTSIVGNGFYPLTPGNIFTPARRPSSMGNDDMRWETSEQLDLGLDLRMLNDRLTFSVDYFDKKTRDLLIWNTTPSLSVGGNISPINAGNVSNKGFEFEIGWRDKIGKDFDYSIKGNLATLKNKVTYLDPSLSRVIGLDLSGDTYPLTFFEKGYPVYYMRGYKVSGIDAKTGDPVFEDLDGDGMISANDKDYIGDAIPDFTYGLTFNAAYKGFDFTLFAQGSYGNDVYCALTKMTVPKANRLVDIWYNNHWTTTNTNATAPRSNCNDLDKYCLSDAMVYDGSYLKIKQIQLGYTLPSALLRKVHINSMRLYVSLEDFFTFTKYIGYDPEVSANSTTGMGVDMGGYPASKKALFGINIEF